MRYAKIFGGDRKTLEAQEPLLRRGVPTLQTSLTSRELPHKTPPLRKQKFDLFFVVAGSCGEDFGLDGRIFPKVRLRVRLVGGGVWNDMRGIALKCGVVGNDPCVVPFRANVTY